MSSLPHILPDLHKEQQVADNVVASGMNKSVSLFQNTHQQ